MSLWGAIEAGGTKFVCAVGTCPEDLQEVRFSTTTPDETLARALGFFREHQQRETLTAVGIGSFGPVDPDPASPRFGYITSTPKPGWAHVDIVGRVRQALGVPVGFDTDVNAAALGEHCWGAAQDVDTFIYLTVGTGLGGGAMVDGRLLHGMVHPEMGHIPVPHDRQADPYPGACSYHGDCLEGLSAGPALEGRWGRRAETLPPDHPAWELEAHYLALGLVSYICVLSPQRIVMGGGVMEQTQLFPLIRRRVAETLRGYLQTPQILSGLDRYIVPPGLGNRAGVAGALALAMRAGGGNGAV
jgi:fructokinase